MGFELKVEILWFEICKSKSVNAFDNEFNTHRGRNSYVAKKGPRAKVVLCTCKQVTALHCTLSNIQNRLGLVMMIVKNKIGMITRLKLVSL